MDNKKRSKVCGHKSAKPGVVWGITTTLIALITLLGCGWGGSSSKLPGVVGDPSRGPVVTVTVPSDMYAMGEYSWVVSWPATTGPYTVSWDFGGGAKNIPAVAATSVAEVSVVMTGEEMKTYTYAVTLTDGDGLSGEATGSYYLGPTLNNDPTIDNVEVEDGIVRVTVDDVDGDDLWVSVASIQGMTVDPHHVEIAGSGTAEFQFTADPAFFVGQAATTITVDDNRGGVTTQTVDVLAHMPDGFVFFAEYDRQFRELTLNMDFSESDLVQIDFSGLHWVEALGGNYQELPGGWSSRTFVLDLSESEENFGNLRVWASEYPDMSKPFDPTREYPKYEATVFIERPVYITSIGYDFEGKEITFDYDAVESSLVEIRSSYSNEIIASNFQQAPGNPDRYSTLVDFSAAEKPYGYGEVTIRDHLYNTDTEKVWLQHESAGIVDDRIYAVFEKGQATVGEELLVVVTTGKLSHPFRFLLNAGLVMDADAEYVARSFNVGSPSGEKDFPDGIWVDVAQNGFILAPDTLLQKPGSNPEDSLGMKKRYDFNVSPFDGNDVLGASGDLLNLRVTYSEPGLKTLAFQQWNGVDRTYYNSKAAETTTYFWDDCSNWHPGLQTSIFVE